jgi:hypothetical protein
MATLDANANELTASGLSTEYILGSSGNPLPVELLSFDCELWNEDQVKLSWQTAVEINNDYFTIERSPDGNAWEEIEKIDGAGNSVERLAYATIDLNPLQGLSYYRLKQTDFDGTYSYSEIRTVSVSKSVKRAIQIYPNPTDGPVYLETEEFDLQAIQVYNYLGEEVLSITNEPSEANKRFVIDLTELPAGMYLIKTGDSTKKIYKL